ncbi:MAG: glycosyltransferase family 2 protein [Phycisphaerae bacterium]|nr:glycosyltransferase family 2 protein [Phycisphaerae bacterium]
MPPEVSFLLPCLNEARSLPGVIANIRACIDSRRWDAEIVLADNGSTDGSADLAASLGCRVVRAERLGYGSAVLAAADSARGVYLVMGDADGSYDFRDAARLVDLLRGPDGADLAMGARFGPGARIEPGAMPAKNRYLGNPFLSWLGRRLFPCDVRDFHCGLRAFTRDAYLRMDLRTTGMEFASEMVIKAAARRLRIAQAPITLRPATRAHGGHLRPWRDGWRHVRFLLLLSPRWALFIPGLIPFAAGILLMALVGFGPFHVALPRFSVNLDIHTMIVGSLLTLVGYQALTVAVAARIFAVEQEIGPPSPTLARAFRLFTLERGLIFGTLVLLAGAWPIVRVSWRWAAAGYGPLDTAATLRPLIAGATLVALGAQTVLMSTFYSMLGVKRR